jgi:hypothetical protein
MRNHGLGASVGIGTDIRNIILLAAVKKAATEANGAGKRAEFAQKSFKTRA